MSALCSLTFMTSRINDCDPLGSTGYPLAFAMNVDAGMSMCLMGSAAQRFRTPGTDGRGGMRSKARKPVRHTPRLQHTKSMHLRLSAGYKHRWTVRHPTSPTWHSIQLLMLSWKVQSWGLMNELGLMPRMEMGAVREGCHGESHEQNAETNWPERWKGRRWEVVWKTAYRASAPGRC